MISRVHTGFARLLSALVLMLLVGAAPGWAANGGDGAPQGGQCMLAQELENLGLGDKLPPPTPIPFDNDPGRRVWSNCKKWIPMPPDAPGILNRYPVPDAWGFIPPPTMIGAKIPNDQGLTKNMYHLRTLRVDDWLQEAVSPTYYYCLASFRKPATTLAAKQGQMYERYVAAGGQGPVGLLKPDDELLLESAMMCPFGPRPGAGGCDANCNKDRIEMCSNAFVLNYNFQRIKNPFVKEGSTPNFSAKNCQPLNIRALVDDPNDIVRDEVRDFKEGCKDYNREDDPNEYQEYPYERLLDPSYPFAPRHKVDIVGGNQRHLDNREHVQCAGQYGKQHPTDIMEWRAPRWEACVQGCCRQVTPKEEAAVIGKGNCVLGNAEYQKCARETPECCPYAMKPVIPCNLIKMRPYDNSGMSPDTDQVKEPVNCGMMFWHFYSANHPYMISWEKHPSCGGGACTRAWGYPLPPDDDKPELNRLNHWTAIVGIGSPTAHCGYNGWHGLKLYQARSTYYFHLPCLAKYEETFKMGSAEEHALQSGGANMVDVRQDIAGNYKDPDKVNPVPDSQSARFFQISYPLGWRGYIHDPGDGSEGNPLGALYPVQHFPYLYSKSGMTFWTNFDDAQAGDIVARPNLADPTNPRAIKSDKILPHVMYVTGAFNNLSGAKRGDPKDHFVHVTEKNYGKFPDICGNTDRWGMVSSRTLYRSVPEKNVYYGQDIKKNGSCSNPDIGSCTLGGYWGYNERASNPEPGLAAHMIYAPAGHSRFNPNPDR